MKDFPYRTFPTGWFQVDWSGALAPGEVKPIRYFDRDLVLYRGTGGEAHIMDAHCPHLGAHLGVGGRVEDDCIVCPFHNWRWDANGENVHVPYSERINKTKRARTWPVLEANGILLMWHDEAGRE